LSHSPGDSSPSFYAGDEAGFFVFIPKDNLLLLFQFSIFSLDFLISCSIVIATTLEVQRIKGLLAISSKADNLLGQK
jgi:hypothetical protein